MPTTETHADELARLQAENERDEQRLRYYENQVKYRQHEIKSLTRKERNHRIFTRGGMLEKFLHYPNVGRCNLTPEQRKYLIGQRYEAERHSHGASDGYRGNQYDKLWSQNGNLGQAQRTCDRIAEESHVSASYVKRAGPYSKGVDAAEEALPGIRQEILSGTIKPTDAQVVQMRTINLTKRKNRRRKRMNNGMS